MKRLFSYLGVALAAALIIAAPASAATSSSGLSITPRKNLNIQPGGSVTDKLTIGNLDHSQDLNITLRVIDFTFTDQTGTPKLMLADNAPMTTWSLKPFLTLPKTLIVPAGQSRTINYTVKIPKNQGAGSYYSAIQYAATGSNGGNVSLSASGVTLVFVSVPGIVNEQMDLKKLGAYQTNPDGANGKFVYIATSKPEQVGFALLNSGNVAEAPAGSIFLKPMFGKKTISIDNLNPNSSLALLGQTRLFLACIQSETQQVKFNGTLTPSTKCKQPSLTPGRYTVSLDAFYGQNGNKTHEITKTASFWYLPWWFIITVLVIIALIGYGIWRLVRKVRTAVNGPTGRRQVQRRR